MRETLFQGEREQAEAGYCSTLGEPSLAPAFGFRRSKTGWVGTSGGTIEGSGPVAVGNLGWEVGGRTAALDKRRGLGRSQSCGCKAGKERGGAQGFFSRCPSHSTQ